MLSICFCAFSQSKPVVVVAPFDAKDIEQSEMDILTEVFISEYANTRKADVVDRNSFDKIKSQLDFQSSDWSNTEKVAELGKALNANLVVVGQIRKMEDSLLAIIRVEDVNSTKILAALPHNLSKVKDINAALDKTTEWCEFLSSKASGENTQKDETALFEKKIAELQAEKRAAEQKAADEKKKREEAEKKASTLKYKIGDRGPGGGWIYFASEKPFYVWGGMDRISNGDCHYLEVSDEDIGVATWCPCKREHDCIHHILFDSIEYSKSNTGSIIEATHQERLRSYNCAAYACYNYSTATTKKGEWYLPSLMDLSLIDLNLKGKLRSEYYWSSTTSWSKWDSDTDAVIRPYKLSISDRNSAHPTSDFFYEDKQKEYAVRAVRAF